MKIFNVFVGGALFLIFIFLILSAPNASSSILGSLGSFGTGIIGTLQGRQISGNSGVTVGGSVLQQGSGGNLTGNWSMGQF